MTKRTDDQRRQVAELEQRIDDLDGQLTRCGEERARLEHELDEVLGTMGTVVTSFTERRREAIRQDSSSARVKPCGVVDLGDVALRKLANDGATAAGEAVDLHAAACELVEWWQHLQVGDIDSDALRDALNGVEDLRLVLLDTAGVICEALFPSSRVRRSLHADDFDRIITTAKAVPLDAA